MKKVFLSSVAQGLEAHREAAYKAISGLDGYHCVRMEDFGAQDAAPADLCRERVRECDIFVGIVGPRYGRCPPDSEISFTELEYETARKESKRRLIFVTHDDFPLPENLRENDVAYGRLVAFRSRVLAERGAAFFTSDEELGREVVTAIHNSQPSEASFRAYSEPRIVRREGWTEVLGDVRLTAFGLKRPEKVDVILSVDTYLTNYYDASGNSDVVISSERRGVLRYARRPDAANKVVFKDVPLDQLHVDGDETLTISGVRADACDAGQQITALLEVSSSDAERRELLRVPLVLALIPSETQFAVERVPDGLASFIGQVPPDAKVRSYVVEFFGAFPGAFKTREEESTEACRGADHGTVLWLQGSSAAAVSSKCRLFATTRNLPPRGWDGTAYAERAALVDTDSAGAPGATAQKPARMLWNGSAPMFEVQNLFAAWEVSSTLSGAATLRFGFCIVGPAFPEVSFLLAFGGLGPYYSTAAAHLPSSTLSIPRFRTPMISETLVSLSLD